MAELLGRDEERSTLARFLDQVQQGPRQLLLEGEAGIGKTALWTAGVAEARQRGYRVLASRPGEPERSLPFLGLGDLMEAVPEESLSGLPSPQRRSVEAALLRADVPGSSIRQRAVALGLLGMLRSLAASAPVLVAIDDLPWLDTPSARVLAFAARRLQDERVGFLLASRIDGALWRGQTDVLAVEDLQTLRVGPLDRDSLASLLHATFGSELPRPVMLRIHRVSGGNPFFAMEIARALAVRGGSPTQGEPLPVPRTLRHLVRERLETLTPAARTVTLAVAALGRPSWSVLLEAAGPETAGLEDALREGIVEKEGERVQLTHPLLGSVLYSQTPRSTRRELHWRLAFVVQDPEQRARHLALAADGPDDEVADALDAASTHAAGRGAPDAAAQLSEEARRLTPETRPAQAARRAREAAGHHFEAGDLDRAATLFDVAARGSEPGLERGRALDGLGRLHLFRGEFDEAIAAWSRAKHESEADPGLSGAIEEGQAFAMWAGGDVRAAREHLRRAVGLAEAAGDRVLLAESLAELAYMDALLGEGLPDDILQRATDLDDWQVQIRVLRRPGPWLAMALLAVGDIRQARDRLEAARLQAADSGDDVSLPVVLGNLSTAERMLGEWESAALHADEAVEMATQMNQAGAVLAAQASRWMLGVLRGESGRVADPPDMDQARTVWSAQLLHASAIRELANGDHESAYGYAGALADRMRAVGIEEPNSLRWIPDAVESLVGMGRMPEAEELLAPFEARAGHLDRGWALGAAARCRGLLLAATRHLPEGVAELDRAVRYHETIPEPFELARTLLVSGSLLRRSKQKREAREALNRALAMFERLGAPLWSDRARSELARIGGRPPAPRSLTPTEASVVRLVSEGRSNKEIAAALFVSPKTVEAALTRIYRKIGISSRTQLVRALHQEEARIGSADQA